MGQVDLYVDATMDNLPELEHHQGFTNSPRKLWKLATTNTALHSLFTHISEPNLNHHIFPQACIDVF